MKTNNLAGVDIPVYFWLGAEGDLIPMTEEEFKNREKEEINLRRWQEGWADVEQQSGG
jgi:hypothetical protein